jgi:hypothetical protein
VLFQPSEKWFGKNFQTPLDGDTGNGKLQPSAAKTATRKQPQKKIEERVDKRKQDSKTDTTLRQAEPKTKS